MNLFMELILLPFKCLIAVFTEPWIFIIVFGLLSVSAWQESKATSIFLLILVLMVLGQVL